LLLCQLKAIKPWLVAAVMRHHLLLVVDKQELKETIAKNNFFESKTDYPPQKENDPSLIAYSLAVTMGGDKIHTTAWTNDSKEMPDGVTKIVDAIRRITAKEKVV
jgi:hypothetical protein